MDAGIPHGRWDTNSTKTAPKQHQNSTAHCIQWAVDYNWKRRAEAYDAHVELTARRGREAADIE